MASTNQYDIIIIGAGLAGLQLILRLMEDRCFDQHEILLIDPDPKDSNDKTWCFWESGEGKWDQLLYHSWGRGRFYTDDSAVELDMGNYRYKMLQAIDFYHFARSRVSAAGNITWIRDRVRRVEMKYGSSVVFSESKTYAAKLVFDSRVSPKFVAADDPYIRILQHFKGWRIKTEKDVFDQESFVMMDFRVKFEGKTCFTYVLPFSSKEALVEFTLFTPDLIEQGEYDNKLKEYIREVLRIDEYNITESEFGIIPMTNYPFHDDSFPGGMKIGTAGGWVKPSSGYSFKNAERKSRQIVSNMASGRPLSEGLVHWRFRWYDSIFLRVLHDNNHLGESVFSDMYVKNPAWRIFRFLDEDSTMLEDLKIIASFEKQPFVRAFMKQLNPNRSIG